MKRIILLAVVLVVTIVSVARNYDGNVTEMISDITNTDEANIFFDEVADKSIDVVTICQYPELPTGCESVSATMLLQFYGEDVTAEEFAGNWLECSADFYNVNGTDYGPDPHKVFAGDPFSEYSYGCYADPIVDAINYNSSMCHAEKITEKSLDELCDEYIDNDEPLLVWATMNMTESYQGATWHLDDGSEFVWIAQEHCLVLVGYNDYCYFLNDPMTGSTVAYEKELVQQRFEELGSQAVHIVADEMEFYC